MRIYDVIDAYQLLTNRSLEISKLYNYFNLQNGNIANSTTNKGVGNTGTNSSDGATLSFEKFCAVMAELSTDGCGMCNIEGREYHNMFKQNVYMPTKLSKLATLFIVRVESGDIPYYVNGVSSSLN